MKCIECVCVLPVKKVMKTHLCLQKISEKACLFFDMSVDEVAIRNKKTAYVERRQMIMRAIKQNTKYTFKSIGKTFGGLDHTTVMHSVKKCIDKCDTEPHFNNTYNNLLSFIFD